MNIKEYLGDLIGSSLLITESRIIAESLLKKLPEDEWKSLIVEQNVLQKNPVRRLFVMPEQSVGVLKVWVMSL